MFSWVSSLFSSSQSSQSLSLTGNLIRYSINRAPKTLGVGAQMHVGPAMNADEYVVKVEDKQWDLDEHLQFSLVSNPHHLAAFSWNDSPSSYMIFILSDPSRVDEMINTVSFFLWRARYGENPDRDDMTEMRQLIGERKFPFDLETLEPLDTESLSTSGSNKQQKKQTREASPIQSRRKTLYPTFVPDDDDSHYDNETELYTTDGDLFLLDVQTNQFEQKGENFHLSIMRLGDASRYITLLVISTQDNQRVMSTPINSTMALSILTDHNAISFNTMQPLATWAFMFLDENEIRAKKLMVQCVWESQYLKNFADLNADDQLYLYQSYIAGIEDQGGYESEDYMDLEEEEDEYEDEDDDEPQLIGSSPAVPSGDKNSLLVDSAKHDRAFVVRGEQIGIFNDETAEYQGMIKVGVKPDQIMLHNGESRILMAHKGKVQALDLTKEKIVEEYQTDTKIKNIGNVQKYAEQTNQQLFAAMTNNSIWGMDPRVHGKDQSINKITYKTNPKFNVFATSARGQLAVGSEDGIIRMYSGIGGLQKMTGKGLNPKSAKTNLPGFGDEIIGIDVSGDGRWILATCKKYLMVIPTEIDNSTGFEKRMGKRKPSPRRLQLLPQDVMKLQGKVQFSPAKFNTGADGETWLVTSTGNFIVTWNFRRVQKNHIHDYTLKRMHDHISAEQFVSMERNATGANEAPIFVVLDNDVAIEKRVKKRHNPFQPGPQF